MGLTAGVLVSKEYMYWLEVSLTVDGEMAEAVADVLARFAPRGVVIESTAIETSLENEGHPVGPLRVCAYLPIDDEIEHTRQRVEESLWYLGRIRPVPRPEFKPIQEVNWAEAWKQHYHPIPVGGSLIVIPSWLDSPDETRIPVRIDPGMAFGTGTHPTTQLCLEMLEAYTPAGGDILDIGCGSGILSIAALKLGAARAFGVDVQEEAIRAAQENAAGNGVGDRVQFALGSIKEINSGLFEIQSAPLVVANILAYILKELLAEGLGDLIAPDGVLILSGILEEQIPEMQAALQTQGLKVLQQNQIEDWAAVVVSR
jgi:ribosomal protein L11 methyltransferase